MNSNASEKSRAQEARYSSDYESIRREAESKWPEWKISTYNTNFATSAHARKLAR